VFSRIPWQSADRVGRTLGTMGYYLSRRYRRAALENLRAAFPGKTEAEVRSLARQTFCNFCRAFVEFFIVGRLSPSNIERIVELRGTEHTDEAMRRGKGGIILTAHLGNWEALARRLVVQGYSLNVIARDSDDPTMTGIVNSMREGGGYNVFSRDEAVRQGLRCLRANKFLGILPDQNTYGNAVFVDFFGRPAATATGAAMFALKTGGPILPTFAAWDRESKRYVGVIHPPLDVPLTGDSKRDVEAITAAYTAVIESEIRKDPSQWLWLHSRWKREGEAPVSRSSGGHGKDD